MNLTPYLCIINFNNNNIMKTIKFFSGFANVVPFNGTEIVTKSGNATGYIMKEGKPVLAGFDWWKSQATHVRNDSKMWAILCSDGCITFDNNSHFHEKMSFTKELRGNFLPL